MMDRGQWANLVRMQRLHPLLFFSKDILGFLITTESESQFNVSSEGRCFLQYSVPITTPGR